MVNLKFLTSEQKKFYDDNGYVKLSNVFTSREIDEIKEAYEEVFERKSKDDLETKWFGEAMDKLTNNKEYTVKSIHALQMHSAVFMRLITHPKLLDALEDIMNTKDILLHHTKAHFKPPEKGGPYAMHQDYPYFPFKNHSMVAAFLLIDDATPENGGLAVYPGSHKIGPLEAHALTDPYNEKIYHVDQDRFPLSGATPISAKKGEVIVFSYLLLHGSYSNLSNRPRRMFLMQARAADDEPLMDKHKSPCQGMVLRGKNIYRDGNINNRYKA